jgi:hypothetical protein
MTGVVLCRGGVMPGHMLFRAAEVLLAVKVVEKGMA